MITKIEINLECWDAHYPTGCSIYSSSAYVDGEYCDNADEFIEFLSKYSDAIKKDRPEILVIVNIMDINNTNVMDCVMEVKNYLENIMYN